MMRERRCAIVLLTGFMAARLPAGQVYYVSEPVTGTIHRVEDINADEDALDAGERVKWTDGLSEPVGLASSGSVVLVVDAARGELYGCQDLNRDGDALDPGERTTWADGLGVSYGVITSNDGAVFVTQSEAGRIWRLADGNRDGDALDPGEKRIYAEGIDAPGDLLAWGDALLVAAFGGDALHVVRDLNRDGDALDAGENVPFTPPIIDGARGLLSHPAGGVLCGAANADTVFRVRDLNGDGDAFDLIEVLSYADAVFGGIHGPAGMAICASGGFLLVNAETGSILRVRDLNGDGDALDIGEVVPFAEGLVRPAGIIGSDLDGDGVLDSLDECPNTVARAIVDAEGCPPVVAGDFDRDGDVDNVDLDHLEACSTGPEVPQIDPLCEDARLDGDADVDQTDFALFQRCVSAPSSPAHPSCMD